ncbi:MAG TPA: beta-phosphoglucomutase [Phycisphaerae bacterium]|nr:beta-phosphoglucomutase [Phycisphaerae bacterium]HPU24640.1 beta-phosphoglucomutase [Phycisphaerae bacterium]
MIDAVIFDLDGVLVRTDELHYRAWKVIADAEGIEFDERINDQLRGVSRMESLEIILRRATRAYTPEEKQALAERKNAIYRDLLQSLCPADVLPGVNELLSGLSARDVALAVASSSKNARTILDRCGLTQRFGVIVDGNDISRSKPDPQVFLMAAEKLGIPPERCLVVEDAEAGILAARRAGMHVFGIGTPRNLPGVEPIAESLSQVNVATLIGRN